MQRRLAIALVLTALVSVVLVGFGILAIAQLGARSRAEDEVLRGLNVVGSLLESDSRALGQLERLVPESRRDLELDRLEPVRVADDGTIQAIVRRPRPRVAPLADVPQLALSADQVSGLDRGETVLVAVGGSVHGLRAITAADAGPDDARLALLASRSVTAIPRRTVVWFLTSSLIVLVGALAAGVVLARRLVRPIRDIQGATASIAAGQLTTRVEVDGEDELAELGRSVNRMAADLERSKALDQQFLMSVSHDLRTPLTAIAGYAEALRDGAVTDPADAGEVIGNHADRLDRLVGDLLDLAKLDANRFRLDLRPVDLTVVAGRTVAGLAPRAAEDGVTIEQVGDRPAIVLADADRLAQAIGNMITNAIAFARSRVTVEVSTADGAAAVAISDDGPGFATEDLPHVFDRLYTGRARPARTENPTGLGLAIVRELAGAMGGGVEATNDPGGGARIVLTLPRHRSAGSDAAGPADHGRGPTTPAGGSPRPPAQPRNRPGPPASPGSPRSA